MKKKRKRKKNAALGLGAVLDSQSSGAQSRLKFLLPASFSDIGHVNSESSQSREMDEFEICCV